MNLASDTDSVAPRTKADPHAVKAAYQSGQVFIGKIDIPTIDIRHYMEDDLDMHHSVASLQARARIVHFNGHADNHIIWVTHKPHDVTDDAFKAIDEWMFNLRLNPSRSVGDNRPENIQDACYADDGQLIAAGKNVWNGDWNKQPVGRCYEQYPPFSTSRLVAGDNFMGDTLDCTLIPVEQAVKSSMYDPLDMRNYQLQLEQIFPDGVCDYSERPGSKVRLGIDAGASNTTTWPINTVDPLPAN